MSSEKPSPTIEDYLGVIYTLERDQERVIGARLAESLDVSAPTVTSTLKRMVRDGWIRLDKSKEIYLTRSGRVAAMSVIRRHMLTEWMLSRVLKLPLSEIHREAHQIEHTISLEVEQRLQEEMQEPRVCPHGNPLPGYENEVRAWFPLSDAKPGDELILRRIHESLEDDYEVLSFLELNKLIPGAHLLVMDVLSFNETMCVEASQQEVILGLGLAGFIYVSNAAKTTQTGI